MSWLAEFARGAASAALASGVGSGRRPEGAAGAGADLELHLQLAARREREHVLQQPHVVVLEPDFAEVVGHFQREAVVVEAAGAQRGEPEVVRVGTEHGTKMFLRRTPNLFCGGLHFFSQKADFRAFYSPSH